MSKDKYPLQDLPVRNLENKKEIVPADKTITPFSFESEILKIKFSLPFNEIFINNEYRNQVLKMLKVESNSIFSDVVNLQDDNPAIIFGPRMDISDDDEVPPFYVTLRIHDLFLHNSMFDSRASHNLMPSHTGKRRVDEEKCS